jgi:hypothetical protein
LNLKNKKIENDYTEMKNKNLKYYNLKILIFSLITSLCIGIYLYTTTDEEIVKTNMFLFNSIMTTIGFSSCFLLGLYFLFSKKSVKIVKWANYYIFYFQIFSILSIRYLFFKHDHTHMLHFFEYLFEIVIRLTWVVLYLHSFYQCMILNALSLITVWLVISTLIPEECFNFEMINTSAYSCVIFSIIGIGYLMERQQKLAFYFSWQAEAKAKWLNNVFENLNSGFVSFKDGSINNINCFFKNQLEKLKKKKNKNLEKLVFFCENTLTKENSNILFKSEYEKLIKPVLKILSQIKTESISKNKKIQIFNIFFYK